MNVSRETFYLLLHMQGFRENVSVKKIIVTVFAA